MIEDQYSLDREKEGKRNFDAAAIAGGGGGLVLKKKCVGVAWAIPVPGSIRSSINDTRNHRNIDPTTKTSFALDGCL